MNLIYQNGWDFLLLSYLGESILGIVAGLAGHEWNIYSTLSVGLGLSIPFSLWWIYFDNVGGSAIRAATERGKRRIYYIWLYIHFPLVVGIAGIGIGIRQVASSNQEMSLPSSDLWLICGSVSSCLFVQGILHLVAVEDSDIRPKTRRKWATYRIVSGIIIISIAILNLELFPVTLMLILSFVCALQIVLNLRIILNIESLDCGNYLPSVTFRPNESRNEWK